MLLRCSICQGQFEVEPSPSKTTVFCSHCGAPLDMRSKARRPMSAKSPTATNTLGDAIAAADSTAPQETAGESLENIFSQPDIPEETLPIAQPPRRPQTPRYSTPKAYTEAPTNEDDPLALLALSSKTKISNFKIRKLQRNRNKTPIVVLAIILTVLISGIIVLGVFLLHHDDTPTIIQEPPKIIYLPPTQPPAHEPGELYSKVQAAPAERAPANPPSDTPPASTDTPPQ